MDLWCLTAVHDFTWHNFSLFWMSVRPPCSVLLFDGKRYILIMRFLLIFGAYEFDITG